MLTKHCCGCGRNLGINYYFVNEDGTWSEMCKFVKQAWKNIDAIKPKNNDTNQKKDEK